MTTTPMLVPLDGKPHAEHALPIAALLARRIGAPLELVHVHGTTYSDDRSDVRDLDSYMHAVAERVRAGTGLAPVVEMLEGSPVQEISRHAQKTGALAIVLSTSPKGLVERLFGGSVAEGLIRHARRPVLIVRPRAAQPDLADARPCVHVLIPLDGSAESEQIIPAAIAAGIPRNARCTLLHVAPAVGIESLPPASGPENPEGYLESIAPRLAAECDGVETAVVHADRASDAILEVARARSADLIALATHGHGGIRDIILGSTAKVVVRESHADLMLYRPHR